MSTSNATIWTLSILHVYRSEDYNVVYDNDTIIVEPFSESKSNVSTYLAIVFPISRLNMVYFVVITFKMFKT